MNNQDYTQNNLRKYRLLSGMTQKEVAKRIGLEDSRRLSKWENGKLYPNIIYLLKLSIVYSTLTDQLYLGLLQKLKSEIEKPKQENESNPP